MSSATPTPLPPDCSRESPASMWNRTIAILSLPAWIEKIVDLKAPEDPSAPGKTIFSASLPELVEKIESENRPLVLLHADSLADADMEIARRALRLPCAPLVALLGPADAMQSAFDAARKLGLSAIFPDDCLQHRRELLRWADWMARGGPEPGIERHLESGVAIERIVIRRREDKAAAIERILTDAAARRPDQQFLFDLRLVLEETINNAIFHAFCGADGGEKYAIDAFEGLSPEESVEVAHGSDSQSIAVCVTDNQGRLRGGTILGKIERHLSAQGVLDQSGRGLYLTYYLSGRALFNIERGRMTQVVALFPSSPSAWNENTPLRPLLIFEKA